MVFNSFDEPRLLFNAVVKADNKPLLTYRRPVIILHAMNDDDDDDDDDVIRLSCWKASTGRDGCYV